jgi:hypothetical protein
MPLFTLDTLILAPLETCFALSRSIDLHTIFTQHTGERAIAGVTTGLIGLGDTVTWQAKHFIMWQTWTSQITEFDGTFYFVGEMVQGAFNRFRHEHRLRLWMAAP